MFMQTPSISLTRRGKIHDGVNPSRILLNVKRNGWKITRSGYRHQLFRLCLHQRRNLPHQQDIMTLAITKTPF
jgi:hypothetical protein